MQDLNYWDQGCQARLEAIPGHAMALASAPERLQPTPQHILAKRF
jgi:hypothetical protein